MEAMRFVESPKDGKVFFRGHHLDIAGFIIFLIPGEDIINPLLFWLYNTG
jgi:hypothetical protein